MFRLETKISIHSLLNQWIQIHGNGKLTVYFNIYFVCMMVSTYNNFAKFSWQYMSKVTFYQRWLKMWIRISNNLLNPVDWSELTFCQTYLIIIFLSSLLLAHAWRRRTCHFCCFIVSCTVMTTLLFAVSW